MTATTLIKQWPNKKITLIESPNHPTIGVGESTINGIGLWLESVGLNKNLPFLKDSDGTIKLSIRFEDFYRKSRTRSPTLRGAADLIVPRIPPGYR